ncbi:MAG: GNAT family N-acetyltransferase [Bacteroidota bacterium]
MSLNFSLKPYDPKWFPALESWVENEETLFIFAAVDFTWPLTTVQLENHMQKHPGREWYIGFVDDEPVAFGEIIPTERNIPRLGRLIIDYRKRGKGIGQQLLAALEQRCVERFDCKAVELYVFEGNERAIAAYLKYGFVFVPIEDAVLTHNGREIVCHKMQHLISN